MVMPPLGAHHLPTPLESRPRASDIFSESPFDQSTGYASHCTSWTPIDAITPISTAPSRKRSRDETACDSDSYFPSQQVNTPATIPEETPTYGEGMSLLNPKTGMSISAESQTGTWYEERVEKESRSHSALADTVSRSQIHRRHHKSMRLDFNASQPIVDHNAVVIPLASHPNTSQPEIDDCTITLGIGWTKVSTDDPDAQAAARGWARYLENHYRADIHTAQILLKSEGLNAYLVGCREGYYLFSEDLLKGKLVAKSWENCLRNLKAQPLAFECQDILQAERTPGSECTIGNGTQFNEALNIAGSKSSAYDGAILVGEIMELD